MQADDGKAARPAAVHDCDRAITEQYLSPSIASRWGQNDGVPAWGLGHAWVAFTMDRYGQLFKQAGSQAAGAVAAMSDGALVTKWPIRRVVPVKNTPLVQGLHWKWCVPGAGFEPARPLGQRLLRPPRLPFRHPGLYWRA